MRVPEWARLAAESFSFITGIDLPSANLNMRPPDAFEQALTDDPGDDNTDLDDDADLPWPDADAIQQWWDDHKSGFHHGLRYFCGKPPSVQHCSAVLQSRYQRQRVVAAIHLALLQFASLYFDCCAPAWVQAQ